MFCWGIKAFKHSHGQRWKNLKVITGRDCLSDLNFNGALLLDFCTSHQLSTTDKSQFINRSAAVALWQERKGAANQSPCGHELDQVAGEAATKTLWTQTCSKGGTRNIWLRPLSTSPASRGILNVSLSIQVGHSWNLGTVVVDWQTWVDGGGIYKRGPMDFLQLLDLSHCSGQLLSLGFRRNNADSILVVEQLFTLADLLEGSYKFVHPLYRWFAEKAYNPLWMPRGGAGAVRCHPVIV